MRRNAHLVLSKVIIAFDVGKYALVILDCRIFLALGIA